MGVCLPSEPARLPCQPQCLIHLRRALLQRAARAPRRVVHARADIDRLGGEAGGEQLRVAALPEERYRSLVMAHGGHDGAAEAARHAEQIERLRHAAWHRPRA